MEVCAGCERIAIENTTTRGDDLLEIGKGREAQMICHMRHGSPPRLMAPQSTRSADLRESSPTPSPRERMTRQEVRERSSMEAALLELLAAAAGAGIVPADALERVNKRLGHVGKGQTNILSKRPLGCTFLRWA